MNETRRKDTKRAATSRKRSGIRRPDVDRYRPEIRRLVLEDIDLYAVIRDSFRDFRED